MWKQVHKNAKNIRNSFGTSRFYHGVPCCLARSSTGHQISLPRNLVDLRTFLTPSKRPILWSKCQQSRITMGLNMTFLSSGYQQGRQLHTTARREINAIFDMTARQVAKLMAIITGRQTRKWWQKLPQEQKMKFLQRLKRQRRKLGLVAGFILGYGSFNYWLHLEVAPVTGRKRYIAFSQSQFDKIAKYEFNQLWEELKQNVLPPDHPAYRKIVRVVTNIIDLNQDLDFFQKQHWTVVVVKSNTVNAFVLPNGVIFVYTGLLEAASNEDQLAYVLGHEMAHALLQHAAEKISWAGMLNTVSIFVLAALWALVPRDGIAFVTQYFMNEVMHVMLSLPYIRLMETEADQVGLQLMAKACYDIRESSAFWQQIELQYGGPEAVSKPEWLSTHPKRTYRVEQLNSVMEEVMEIRESCNCPKLALQDPREIMRQMAADHAAYVKSMENMDPEESKHTPAQSLGACPIGLVKQHIQYMSAKKDDKEEHKITTAVQKCFIPAGAK